MKFINRIKSGFAKEFVAKEMRNESGYVAEDQNVQNNQNVNTVKRLFL